MHSISSYERSVNIFKVIIAALKLPEISVFDIVVCVKNEKETETQLADVGASLNSRVNLYALIGLLLILHWPQRIGKYRVLRHSSGKSRGADSVG